MHAVATYCVFRESVRHVLSEGVLKIMTNSKWVHRQYMGPIGPFVAAEVFHNRSLVNISSDKDFPIQMAIRYWSLVVQEIQRHQILQRIDAATMLGPFQTKLQPQAGKADHDRVSMVYGGEAQDMILDQKKEGFRWNKRRDLIRHGIQFVCPNLKKLTLAFSNQRMC